MEAVIQTKLIYFGFFAAMVGLIIRHPAAAAGAMLCTWAIDQWAGSQDNWFFVNHGLTNWITSTMLLISVGLRALKGKPIFQPFTREYAITAGIFGMAALSLIWSIDPEDTKEQFLGLYRVIVLFAFLMPLLITDLEDLKVMLYTVLCVGLAIAVLVLATGKWQGRQLMFMTGGVFTSEGMDRGNPLAIANIASYVALAAMLMNFRGVARFWQMFRYVIIAVAFSLSVKTGSRGQTMSILFCTLCFLPYSRRFRDVRSFGAFAISIVLFAGITLYLLSFLTSENAMRGDERWSYDTFIEDYGASRIGTAMRVLSAWANAGPFYWFFGIGSSASFLPSITGSYCHVVFAEVLGELGLVGWALLWCFPIFTFQNLKEMWGYVKDDVEQRGLISTLGGLVLFEIMMSFKQGSLLGSSIAFAFAIILGRITVTYRHRYAQYAALDAGMYAMAPADWDDADGSYDDSRLPAAAH